MPSCFATLQLILQYFFLVKFLNNLSWDFQKFLSLQILHILWTVFCSFYVYKYTQFVGNIEFVIDEIHNIKNYMDQWTIEKHIY